MQNIIPEDLEILSRQDDKTLKEKELGEKLLGSIGYMKRELLSSVEWVNVFDELETFPDQDAITAHVEKMGFKIAQCENDGEEFRVWIFRK